MKTQKHFKTMTLLTAFSLVIACGGPATEGVSTGDQTSGQVNTPADPNDPMSNKGVGPIQNVTLGALDEDMAAEGQKIFQEKCSACHKPDEKFIGPAPKGILDRRSPEWIMNMILSPEKMVKDDPIAKQLLMDYNLAPMANQNLTEDQARKILEYFRTLK